MEGLQQHGVRLRTDRVETIAKQAITVLCDLRVLVD